jgi:hypothetical protein
MTYCTPARPPAPKNAMTVQYPNQTFAYENLRSIIYQNDSTMLGAPGFTFADVMKVMGVSDPKAGINKTFQFATPWARNGSNTDVAKAGILWKTNKHRPSTTNFQPDPTLFNDTYFIGFVSPVKGGGFNNGTFVASDFTWQLTDQGIPILMAATPYTAHVGFLNIFHYGTNYAIQNLATNTVFGYQNKPFKGTRIVGLDILSQEENAENAQAGGILGQFGMAKTSDGNTFLMYTDQGKFTSGANMGTPPTFPVIKTGNTYTVSVMHGEPNDTGSIDPTDTNSKDESAQLYPTIGPKVTNTLTTAASGIPTIAVDPSVKNSYLRWSWSQDIVITEHNLTEYTIAYALNLPTYPGDPEPIKKSYSIPPGGSNVCFQMLMPHGMFTLTSATDSTSVSMPLRNYLQAGDYVGRPFAGGCLNVLIRNTKNLGSNVYYYTDPSKIPPMSTAEAVYGELSVQPPIKLSNAAEIGILVAAVVVLVIVVAVVAWWFTKGKKARDLKLQASVPSSST